MKDRRTFTPSKKTVLLLRQWELSQGKIKDFVDAYLQIEPSPCDQGFINFCRNQTKPPAAAMFPKNWTPNKCLGLPFPSAIEKEYLSHYQGVYSESVAPSGDLEAHFRKYCIAKWEHDCRNPDTTKPTIMRPDWWPQPETISILSAEGFPMEYIEMLILEFRLYWAERGEPMALWDLKFIRNSRWRLERKKRHNLTY